MNSSSGTLQNNQDIIFYLLIYIPANIVSMIVTVLLFSVANRLLRLRFPTWAVAGSAALLVVAMMFAFIDGSSTKGGLASSPDITLFYTTTLIINAFIATILVAFTGINKLIFSSGAAEAFAFRKPQFITTIIYSVLVSVFALMPLMSRGSGYLSDVEKEEQLQTLQKVIDRSDTTAFIAYCNTTSELWKIQLPGEQRSLLTYLVAHDKTTLVHILTRNHKEIFTYPLEWDIKSLAMAQMLVVNGMNLNKLIEELTAHNQVELVKIIVDKYHPIFTFSVSYIAKNVLRNNDIELLDYLIKNGLAQDTVQSHEAIYWLIESGDLRSAKLLIEKGFRINKADKRLVYLAIQHSNLPLLQFLVNYGFDVNVTHDEFTNLEHAIMSGHEAIFNFLLTQNPDVKTLHQTKPNGATNALLIAEKYGQVAMLAKLKRYVDQR